MTINKKAIFVYTLDLIGCLLALVAILNLTDSSYFVLSNDQSEQEYYAWILVVLWLLFFIPRMIFEYQKERGIGICRKCGGELKEEDFIGTFTTPIFQGNFAKAAWPLPRLFLFGVLGLYFINTLFSDQLSNYIAFVYMAVVVVLISLRFMAHLNNLIYRCLSCDSLYKGIKQIEYRYGK